MFQRTRGMTSVTWWQVLLTRGVTLGPMVAGTSHLLPSLTSLERTPEEIGHLLVLKNLEIALL